jgi:putative ubiquitin-RnfH superfamily antitoxin RatB of RatAB toxin-antitoxin module
MSMRVEVIYALPQKQERVLLDLPPDSTVQDALQASGLLQRLPQIEFGRLGVWGRPVTPETRLRHRDRVEIYRPLIADPKEVRRERAAKARK